MDIAIEKKKTLEENAEVYYEKAKKAKAKIPGIKKIITDNEKKRQKLEKERDKRLQEIEKEEEELQKKKAVKKEWYEKFRWFFTSAGFLVIGGRDATTNDIIIKKHADKGDVIFHTDMAGSPFFVIKAEGKTVDAQSMQETAQATAVYSRGWQKGLACMDVFSCDPSAIGRQVAKGAFVIEGEVIYYKPVLEIAIGVTAEEKVMGGAESAVKAHCEHYVVVIQGQNKKSDTAKSIKQKLGGDLDSIMQVLPTGGSKIKK